MRKTTRMIHLLALCLFVGSIPAHIFVGRLAGPAQGTEAFAVYLTAKQSLTTGLTFTGLVLTLITGALLAASSKGVFRQRWLRLKLILTPLIVINGALILSPLGERMKDMAVAAAAGPLPAEFHAAVTREAVAGAINLLLILAIVALSVFRPKLGAGPGKIRDG